MRYQAASVAFKSPAALKFHDVILKPVASAFSLHSPTLKLAAVALNFDEVVVSCVCPALRFKGRYLSKVRP